MGALFSKRRTPSRVTAQDKAVLQLKHQRDQLKQYQKKIELKLQSDRELACKLLKENKKERAKLLLRKKRYQEQLLQKTDAQLDQLERMTHDIEFTQIEMQVVEGLKNGNEALKKMHDAISIDEIERIMDETREGVEKQEEIDALLSGALTEEDELAVETELEEIIKEAMPEVPTDTLPEEDVEMLDVPASPERAKKEKQKKQKVALEAS